MYECGNSKGIHGKIEWNQVYNSFTEKLFVSQVNLLRLKSSVNSKWATVKTFGG